MSAPAKRRAAVSFSRASLALTLLTTPAWGVADDGDRYTELISQGNKLLSEGKLTEANALSLEAVALDKKRFEGYALGALVMLAQQSPHEAIVLVDHAIQLAPADKLATLKRLKATAEEQGETQFISHLEAGKQAAAQNLMARAAREYELAWTAKPEAGQVGLQAAVAFAAVQDYANSSRIAKQLATSADPEIAKVGKEHLERLSTITAPAIIRLLDEAKRQLNAKKGQEAEATLKQALDSGPASGAVEFSLVKAFMLQGKTQEAADAAKQAISLGYTNRDEWKLAFQSDEMIGLARQQSFRTLILDAFGKTDLDAIDQIAAKGQQARNASVQRALEAEKQAQVAARERAIALNKKQAFAGNWVLKRLYTGPQVVSAKIGGITIQVAEDGSASVSGGIRYVSKEVGTSERSRMEQLSFNTADGDWDTDPSAGFYVPLSLEYKIFANNFYRQSDARLNVRLLDSDTLLIGNLVLERSASQPNAISPFSDDPLFNNTERQVHDEGCFIATAAYGSYWDANVLTLRRFRDQHLLTNGFGKRFVVLYYRFSPRLADFIRPRSWARQSVRCLLTPFISVAASLEKANGKGPKC